MPYYPQNALYVQDENALIHGLKDLPSSFGAICLIVLDQMVSKKHVFVFSTDSYFKDSIKAQERRLHMDGPATRKSPYMNIFLQNDENKRQLCDLLLRVCRAVEMQLQDWRDVRLLRSLCRTRPMS